MIMRLHHVVHPITKKGNLAMRREDVLKEYGMGSLPRILDTLNCFRRRYGHWPTRLIIDEDMMDALQQDCITPSGWKALTARVELRSIKGTVIAEDASGQSYEYASEFIRPENKDSSADYWIWGCEVWPSTE